jgi:hypothetical protein
VRSWNEQQIAAGYHEQEWGTASPDSQLVGTYRAADGTTVMVGHLPVGTSGGPEFEIEWETGLRVTVIDEATALLYLIDAGAAEYEDDEEVN